MCHHQPSCPPASAADRDAARVLTSHPEQGWSLLCNGVVAFDDSGDLLPDGHVVDPTDWLDARSRRARLTADALASRSLTLAA